MLRVDAILHGKEFVEVRVHRTYFRRRQSGDLGEVFPPARLASDLNKSRPRLNRSWCRGLCEILPIFEECFDSAVLNNPCIIETGELIEISESRPACVFEALSKMIAIYVALDFDNDDATGGAEGENIWNITPWNMCLNYHGEEGLSRRSFQIFPNQSLYFSLVEIWTGVSSSKWHKLAIAIFVNWHLTILRLD